MERNEGESSSDGKRNRENDDQVQFSKSRKTIRTPERRYGNSDKGINELKAMMTSIMEDLNEMKTGQKSLLDTLNSIKEENKSIKEENRILKERVEQLESKWENTERQKRKNNIIIKGAECEREHANAATEDILIKKLAAQVEIKQVEYFKTKNNIPMITVKLGNWEDKQEIMRNRHKLKGTNIYIDNDMTRDEQHIQAQIRNMAKEERRKGATTRIGHMKLTINDVEWVWNKHAGGLIKKVAQNKISKND